MWCSNRWNLDTITALNESDGVIGDDGLPMRSRGTEVSLDVLMINEGKMMFYSGDGRFVEDGIKFQVSWKELTDNDFWIYAGKTYFTYKENEYRVMEVLDYTDYPHIQLMECKSVKIKNVN